jgi:hypothetical protein
MALKNRDQPRLLATIGTVTPSSSALRVAAQVRELDRRIYALRLRRRGVVGIVVPGAAVVVAMVFLKLIEMGGLTMSTGTAGLGGLITSGAAAIWAFHALSGEIADHEGRRAERMASLEAPAASHARRRSGYAVEPRSR